MGLLNDIPEHFGSANHHMYVISFLQQSTYTLAKRQAAWEKWCDRVGHVPCDDETEALASSLPPG